MTAANSKIIKGMCASERMRRRDAGSLKGIRTLDSRRRKAGADSGGANRKQGTFMKNIRWVAAALLVVMLSACVGFVVPIPLSASSGTQDTERDDRR